jgi:hypothetical protein
MSMERMSRDEMLRALGTLMGMFLHYEEMEARVAEFQEKYRGQVANDGTYPEHLFQAKRGG